jgi:soluble lytic murein transglycosylase-like protein
LKRSWIVYRKQAEPSLRERAGYLEDAALQGRFEQGQAAPVIQGAERLGTTARRDRHQGVGFHGVITEQGGFVDQFSEEIRGEARKVACGDKDPIRWGSLERGLDAAHGAAAGMPVGNHGESEMRITLGRAHECHRQADFAHDRRDMLDECAATVRKERFIRAHARTFSPGEHKTGDGELRPGRSGNHAIMVASRMAVAGRAKDPLDYDAFTSIIRENGFMKFCFMAALVAVTATMAWAEPAHEETVRATARAESSAAPPPATTVRTDGRGRLVRTVVVPSHVVRPRVVAERQVNGLKSGDRAPITSLAELDRLVEEMSAKHNLDPLLVHAIIHVESGYNPYALSYKGAEGLMQLIPGTARRMGVKNSFDMHQNIDGGARYLRQMLDRFGGDLRYALAGYNAGPEAVVRWKGIPPYAETQSYVYKVGKRYGELRRIRPEPKPEVQTAELRQPEPEFRPVESYLDAEGRLHLRTR